jgi:hypothetical protein
MLSQVSTDYFEFGLRNAECGIKKGRKPNLTPNPFRRKKAGLN